MTSAAMAAEYIANRESGRGSERQKCSRDRVMSSEVASVLKWHNYQYLTSYYSRLVASPHLSCPQQIPLRISAPRQVSAVSMAKYGATSCEGIWA